MEGVSAKACKGVAREGEMIRPWWRKTVKKSAKAKETKVANTKPGSDMKGSVECYGSIARFDLPEAALPPPFPGLFALGCRPTRKTKSNG